MNRATRIGIGLAISVAALYLALPPRNEWGRVIEAFGRVRWEYLLPLALLSAYSIVVRCQRWQVLLRPVARVPFLPLLSATSIGFLCNMVLPLRVGEVVRPVLLARRARLPVSSVLASVVVERLLDMLTILVFLAVVIAVVPVPASIRRGGFVLVISAGLAVTLVLMLQRRHPLALRITRATMALLPRGLRARAESALHDFIEGLQGLGDGSGFRLAAYSLYLWTVIASVFGVGLLACELHGVPLVRGSLAIVTGVAVAVSAPSAPGFIGTFQVGCVLALGLFGVAEPDAIPYAFVTWAVQWLTQIALGVVFLMRENVSFRDLQHVEESGVTAERER